MRNRKPQLGKRYKSHPTTRGLVGWWLMNEGDGDKVYDLTRNNITGTLTNMDPSTDWVPGNFGGSALDFDGTNDFINLGSNTKLDLTGGYTISVWIKQTGSFSNYENICFKKINTINAAVFGIISLSTGVWLGQQSDVNNITGGQLVIDTWHHLAYVNDGTNRATYQDGVLQNSDSLGNILTGSTQEAYIGSDEFNARRFGGLIEDFRIYNRGLSAGEIISIYKNPFGSFSDGNPFYPRIKIPLSSPGGTTHDGSITLAVSTSHTPTTTIDYGVGVSFGLSQGVSDSGLADYVLALTLAKTLSFTSDSDTAINASLSLATQLAVANSTLVDYDVNLTMGLTEGLTQQVQWTSNAAVNLNLSAGQSITTNWTSNAGITFTVTVTMQPDGSAGSLITAVTPDGRKLYMRLENRTLYVRSEDRTIIM